MNTFDLKNSVDGVLVRVTYDEIAAREQFRLNLKTVTDSFIQDYQQDKNMTENRANKKLQYLFHAYIYIIFHFSITLKEPKWAGEQEWRLVLFKAPSNQELSPHGQIQYRTRQSELVDYLIVDTKICGYEFCRVKTGYYFPTNSLNGLENFLTLHSLKKF